jgi:hypothetical protein
MAVAVLAQEIALLMAVMAVGQTVLHLVKMVLMEALIQAVVVPVLIHKELILVVLVEVVMLLLSQLKQLLQQLDHLLLIHQLHPVITFINGLEMGALLSNGY